MSISFSYLTTMAWEKFVEKYDDFMRNSKTKIDNEKTIKNYQKNQSNPIKNFAMGLHSLNRHKKCRRIQNKNWRFWEFSQGFL